MKFRRVVWLVGLVAIIIGLAVWVLPDPHEPFCYHPKLLGTWCRVIDWEPHSAPSH